MRNSARSFLPNASGFARTARGQDGRGRYGVDVRSAQRFGGLRPGSLSKPGFFCRAARAGAGPYPPPHAPETIFPLPRFNSETFAASGRPRFAASDCGAPPGMVLREMVRSLHISGCCRRAGRPNRIDVLMPTVREYFNRGQENEKRSNRNAPCCKHEAPNISGAQPTSARGDLITLGTVSRPSIRVRFICPSHACVARMATRPGAIRRH